MRKAQKQGILEIINTLYEAHKFVKKYIDEKEIANAQAMMAECQNTAIDLGNIIERSEGEDFSTIKVIGNYCDFLYQVAQELDSKVDGNKIKKSLDTELNKIGNSVRNDIKVKLEIIFMPYKASMWDSLESVWKAADEDPNCDAYVVPIPYYDRNKDGSLGELHYEGREFPEYVPIVDYKSYSLEKRLPDAIYIHNPYDGTNLVTSVHPNFYSSELKKYTECLVYIPYYTTSGGMSEARKYCSAYYNADYIVTQSEKYSDFFDPRFSQQNKLLPFGSPKFDRVINICNNPPEPPIGWKEKMKDKKVYFYNTSIGGFLNNTYAFLLKMKYVFETFANSKNTCLIWRPHPLLETTLDSMRPQYKELYFALKDFFVKYNIGIYDTTPDVTKTIALSDAYIGDSMSSVVSLFGVAGKPIFILDNNITTLPEEDDWKGDTITFFNEKWLITPQNKLYYSPNKDYKFKYICSLSEYTKERYYSYCMDIGDNSYIIPIHAQEIIKVNENGIQKRIKFKRLTEHSWAFHHSIVAGKYIFLIPNNYLAIVRYNTENDEVAYFKENFEFFNTTKDGMKVIGGAAYQNGYIYISSPIDGKVLVIEPDSGKQKIIKLDVTNKFSCREMISDGVNLWFIPIWGGTIVSWNPNTNDIKEYSNLPSDFSCKHYLYKFDSMENFFSNISFQGDYVYLAPFWGNMFIKLNKNTGEIEKWNVPFEFLDEMKSGYYFSHIKSRFFYPEGNNSRTNKLFSFCDRKLYEIDFESNKCNEIKIEVDYNELKEDASGFGYGSEWLQYCCKENAFNSLQDFINEKIEINSFNREKQIEAYGKIAANYDGTCGNRVHEFIRNHLKV